MVVNPDALMNHDLGDRISSVGDGCHAMKELGIFVSKHDLVDFMSFHPVKIFTMQEFLQLSLDHIAFASKKPEIRAILAPNLQL
jgi:hypothetical protein